MHYLNNERFEEVIHQYLGNKTEYEEELMSMFDILINNIVESFKFNIEKDDAKQECFLIVLKTLRKFKPSKGSAFNYFTTVILNNLKLLYTKDKKYDQKLEEYKERLTGRVLDKP